MTTKKTTPIKESKVILDENRERMFLNEWDTSDPSHIKYDVGEVRSDSSYFSSAFTLSDGYTSASFDIGVYSDVQDMDKSREELAEAFEKLSALKAAVDNFVDASQEALKAYAIVRKLQ